MKEHLERTRGTLQNWPAKGMNKQVLGVLPALVKIRLRIFVDFRG